VSRNTLSMALLCVVIILVGCHKSESGAVAPTAEGSVRAPVEIVAQRSMETAYEAVGTVRSKTVSTIQSKVVGHVTAVHVTEGDRVQPEQVLVEIDDREAVAQAQKAEGALSETRAALQELERSINAAESAKAAADANSALADATYRRYKGLAQDQAVSRQLLDEAEAKQKAAAAEASRAEDMLRSFRAKRGEIEARIEQAQAELANAQVLLSYTKVRSPMDGLITRKNVEVGDLASPGTALLEVEDDRHYRLEAIVDEAQVTRLRIGNSGSVTIDALGGAMLTGTLSEIVPAADPASRTSVVKLDLPPTDSLRSGVFGRVKFAVGQTQALTVPQSALVERGQLTGVYVLDTERVTRLRLIKTGKAYGDRVEVLSGLNDGETVVSGNVGAVSDGSRVEP
jgi:multidrug efflux pump subunit AcrA (membrane-fusion protein)